MNNSLISVIIPVYNTEQYLRRCIDSVLAQTFQDFELLLIDDGSTDSSGAICDEYAAQDARVRVFHKENGGVSSARNVGLDHAQGEWITFADSDDYVFSCWLENFVLNTSGNDLVVQGFKTSYPYEFMNNKELHGVYYKGNCKDGLLELHKNRILGYLWVKLFRAEIIRNYRICFDTKISLMEDDKFILDYVAHANNMLSIEVVGYMYYPPYSNKYGEKKNWFYMAQMLFVNSLRLYEVTWNDLVSYYLNYYTEALMDIYGKKQYDRRRYLKVYRNVTGSLMLKSRLFFMSRWVCFLDFTCFLSSFMLDIHTVLNSKIKSV